MYSSIKAVLLGFAIFSTLPSLCMEPPPKKFNSQATADLRELLAFYKKNALDSNGVIQAEQGFIAKLKPLLAQNPDPNAVDKSGCSALQAAVMHGYTNAVRLLLAAHADPNKKTGSGLTLLHLLLSNIPALLPNAQPKRLELLQLLLSRGADMNRKGRVSEHYECSALIAALKGPDMDALEIMLSRFEDNATTPLHLAIRSNANAEVITYVLENFPVSINTQDNHGLTPLHIAAFVNSPHLMYLIRAGANPNAPDQTQETPLHWAMRTKKNAHDAIRNLIENDADPSLRDISKKDAAETAKDQETRYVLLQAVRQHIEKLKRRQKLAESLRDAIDADSNSVSTAPKKPPATYTSFRDGMASLIFSPELRQAVQEASQQNRGTVTLSPAIAHNFQAYFALLGPDKQTQIKRELAAHPEVFSVFEALMKKV